MRTSLSRRSKKKVRGQNDVKASLGRAAVEPSLEWHGEKKEKTRDE